jgi:predicted AAA+ superfamily ATPase
MVRRLFKPPQRQSYLLFGARGTGKTTLLEKEYSLNPVPPESVIFIDLLDPDQEEVFSRNPNRLKDMIAEKKAVLKRVIIDEVQKVPKILDVVHSCIEKNKQIQFILTGSSARKLKHGGGNLLAGRAASFRMHPFTFLECPNGNDLLEILTWGTLPKLFEFDNKIEKQRFLRSYVQTYLKQEIQLEQLVKNIVSFREFLEFAGQTNGEIINFANIAGRSGVDEKTVARYFEILIDTLVGHMLEPFNESIREKQSKKPKFYIFDVGVSRQMNHMLDSKLVPGSSEYGKLFEQMIICECFRLNDYFEKDYQLSYLRTADGAEIDLIVKKSKNKKILIEIKSSSQIQPADYRHLLSLGKDIPHSEKWVISTEKYARQTEDKVRILPWQMALKELFEIE